MKILLISPSIYPNATGGMEIYNYHFANEMIRLGSSVSVISKNARGVNDKAKKFPLFTRNPLLQNIQIVIYLFLLRYDIIHLAYASNSFLADALFFYRKLGGKKKYVIYIHGGGMHPWEDEKIQLKFFRNAARIIGISEPIKKEYQIRSRKNVDIILPIIPFDISDKPKNELRSKLGIDPAKKILLYVGSIKEIKGSDFLVDSLIKLGREYFVEKNIEAIFVGGGPMLEELKELARKAGMDDLIIFKGKKPREEVPEFMKAADIFLNASFFEGAPLSIIEALSNGLLLISSDVSGVNNIVKEGETAYLYQRENFAQFRDSLGKALDNEAEFKIITERSRAEALEKFNAETNFRKHLKLYEDALKK